MDVHVVFHVHFEVMLAHGIDLHLYGICDTVQANGTQLSNGIKEWAFSFR